MSRTLYRDCATVRIAANLRDLNFLTPRKKCSGDAAFVFQDVINRSFHDHFAAQYTRPRSEVDHVICGPHGFFVMLDDDHGVALVAKPLQAAQKHRVVAWMQTDAGFVENVDDSHKSATDLSRQANTLRFTARQCRC